MTKKMKFPLSVFVDSQAFIQEANDFSDVGKFALLKKHRDDGKVKLLTSVIVEGEVKNHIESKVMEALKNLQNLARKPELAILRERLQLKNLSTLKPDEEVKEALNIFNDYISNMEAVYLDLKSIDLTAVIDSYFSGTPPFVGKKKHEFPDALNISMLCKYSEKNGPVYVVSGDKDFAKIKLEDIVVLDKLSAFLDYLYSAEAITTQAKDYINSKSVLKDIYEKVREKIFNMDDKLKVDGRDCDRHGCYDGVEYDEVELIFVSAKNLSNLEVINIVSNDEFIDEIIVEADCELELKFKCSFFDEENSVWDSVDKEYVLVHYGEIEEHHSVNVQIEIFLIGNKDNEKISFEMDDIVIRDVNIELDQYTLQENGRSRIDNPYNKYWYENDEE